MPQGTASAPSTPDFSQPDLMSIEDVARRLNVSVATVRWLRAEGRFAPAIRIGRCLRWDPDVLGVWLERQTEVA